MDVKKGYFKKNGKHSTVSLTAFQGEIMDCLCKYYGFTNDTYIQNALKLNKAYDLRVKINRSRLMSDYVIADAINLLKNGHRVEGL